MEALLVVDAHATSINFAAYDGTSSPGELNLIGKGHVALADGEVEFFVKRATSSHPEIARSKPADGAFDHDKALARMFNWLDKRCGLKLMAVGHRMAQGQESSPSSVLVTDAVLDNLETRIPQQQGHAVRAMRFLRERLPAVPQVACFAPALHRSALQMMQAQARSGPARTAAAPMDEQRTIAANTLRCAGRVPPTAVIHLFRSPAPASERNPCAVVSLARLAG